MYASLKFSTIGSSLILNDVFIKDEILRVDSVISILEYSSSVEQRSGRFSAHGRVETTEGVIAFSV